MPNKIASIRGLIHVEDVSFPPDTVFFVFPSDSFPAEGRDAEKIKPYVRLGSLSPELQQTILNELARRNNNA